MVGPDGADRRRKVIAMAGANSEAEIPSKSDRGEFVYSASYGDGAESLRFAVFVRLEGTEFSARRQTDRARVTIRLLEWILDYRGT